MSYDAHRLVLNEIKGFITGLETSKGRVFEERQDAIPEDEVPCVHLAPQSVDSVLEAEEGQEGDDVDGLERHTLTFVVTSIGTTIEERDTSSKEVKDAVLKSSSSLNLIRRRYAGSLFSRETTGQVPTLQVHQTFEVQYLVLALDPGVILS